MKKIEKVRVRFIASLLVLVLVAAGVGVYLTVVQAKEKATVATSAAADKTPEKEKNTTTDKKSTKSETADKSSAKVKSITLTQPATKTLVLKKGKTYSLKVDVLPKNASNKNVSYISSDESIVTVTEKGKVKAVKEGKATITIKAEDGSGKSAKLQVYVDIPVSEVIISESSRAMTKGETFTLTVSIKPANAKVKEVVWTTSNAAVASVSTKGVVTAKGEGNAVITATAADGSGKKAICKIAVGKSGRADAGKDNKADKNNKKVNQENGNKNQNQNGSNSVGGSGNGNNHGNGGGNQNSNNNNNNNNSNNNGNNNNNNENPDEYKVEWTEDFSGDTLDAGVWNIEEHQAGWVNAELQEYVNSADNVYIKEVKEKDGTTTKCLALKAIKTMKDGVPYYTSGRVSTLGKVGYTYGKIEARIKAPEGKGLLPAFWMMPTNEQFYGQWPRCGEIDIMEVVGDKPGRVYSTIHYGVPHAESQGFKDLDGLEKYTDDFHIYGVEWKPDSLEFSVDGKVFHKVNDWYTARVEGEDPLTYPAPFDQEFGVILNLAVGGNWPGSPNVDQNFDDIELLVDWVKISQLDSYDTNVTKPEKEEVVLRDADETGNFINNGDFKTAEALEDDKDWKFMTALGGMATAVIKDGKIRIESTSEGEQEYSVQLVQAGLPMKKGTAYRLSFEAKADEPRNMITDISAPDKGWSRYLADTRVALETDWKSYSYDFAVVSESDANGRVEFNLGKQGSVAAVEIRNVRLEKTGDVEISNEKSILSDGNHVYNGKFQIGEGRLAYWNIDNGIAGAKVEVTNEQNGTGQLIRELKVSVPESGADLSRLVIRQTKLAILPGKTYALSFDARGDRAKTIQAKIDGQVFEANLTTETKTYTYKFDTNNPLNGKDLELFLGAAGVTYIDNVELKEAGLIINGEFDNGLIGWETFADSSIASGVKSSAVDDNGETAAKINIQNNGDAEWKIQLMQRHIVLEKGKWYKFSVKARADVDRALQFALQRDGNIHNGDWTGYATDVKTLTNVYQTFSKTFEMTNDTDPETICTISMGAIGGAKIASEHNIFIGAVNIEEVEKPADENNGAELIKNGDFAKGSEDWIVAVNAPGEATYSFQKNAAEIDVTNAGSNDWNVQLKQSGLKLEKGKTYDVKVLLQSEVARAVKFDFLTKSYDWYAGKTFDLNAGEELLVEHSFTVEKETDPAIDFLISLGKIGDSTPTGKVTIKNVSVVCTSGSGNEETGNLLKNADFAEGDSNWIFAATTPGVADVSWNANATAINVENPGTEDWNVQLKQNGIKLENGKTYNVKIVAESTVSRTIKYDCLTASYDWYGGEAFNLNAGEEFTFEKGFTVSKPTNPEMSFVISMGKIGDSTPAGKVIIKSVSLTEATGTETGGGSETGAAGNLIQNSDFSAGELNWNLAVTAPGAATIDWSAKTAAINVTNLGTEEWHVQLKQSGLKLEKGKTYDIEILFESTVERKVGFGCSSSSGTWYGGGGDVLPAGGEKTLKGTLAMNHDTDEAASFVISMGKNDIGGVEAPLGLVTVKRVSLKVADGSGTGTGDGTETGDGSEIGGESETGAAVNLIQNSDFAAGNAFWYLALSDTGAADADWSANTAAINVTSLGTEEWHVQLKQDGLKLEKGKTYNIEILFNSTVERKVGFGCSSSGGTWYGGDGGILTAGGEQTLNGTFAMNNDTDEAASFVISMGRNDINGVEAPLGLVTIKKVSLKAAE